MTHPRLRFATTPHAPVTAGLPFPRGALTDPSAVRLRNGSGQPTPVQTRPLDLWPDGSIRWLLLDWHSDDETYEVLLDGPGAAPPHALAVKSDGRTVLVETRSLRFRIGPETPFPFAVSTADGRPVLGASCLRGEDEGGGVLRPELSRVWVEDTGPLRVRVCTEGVLRHERGTTLVLLTELDVFAGSDAVRLQITLRNPRRAAHPGGTWDLGDAGSVMLRDVSLAFDLVGDTPPVVCCSPEPGHALAPVPTPFELYQDSSGGENWRSDNHLNRHRRVPTVFRGYRIRHAGVEGHGLRATPVVTLQTDESSLAVAVPRFWQNFPKAIEVDGRTVTIRLFPRQAEGGHELQGGEQKTHVVYLSVTPGGDPAPLGWCLDPPVARADPEWYCASGAVPHLHPRGGAGDAGYDALVDSAVDGSHSFERKREIIDEYGWRHFGDIYGDHEATLHRGPTPLVSHYNNQYDAVFGSAVQFLRGGDRRWWHQMDEMAWHVLDIDIYHTDEDKPLYNRGLFWHTVHYVDADTSTHRSYPRRGSPGGGPACDHNYAAGLILHHFLTGCRLTREAGADLARRVVLADDGSRTVFRWLAGGWTGLPNTTWRASGNSLSALVDGHRLTGEPELLAKAEELLRRVIHPADNVPAMNLENAENCWFYTMTLHAVGKYLHHKIELGQIDAAYAYARAALLHYARWMAGNERPSLDSPVEYPTETWPAQDMRKCEVFWYAWLHADGPERVVFAERATFFYRYSVQTLSGMPTRHLCRPVVLLMGHGFRQGWFETHPEERAPAPPTADFGHPATFEGQKVRAIRRAKLLLVAGAVAATVTAVVVAWQVWWLPS